MPSTSSEVDSTDEQGPRKLSLGLLLVAVTSSLLASTCCLFPLVLVLLGITGAWMVHLSVLKPWVPLLTAIAVVALVGSGYLLFRPLRSCNVSDDVSGVACVDSRRVAQRIYLVSGLLVSALLLFPVVAPIFY
jgi:mercuric ion transport protein